MENSIILQNINAEGLKALIGEVVAEKLAALVPSQSSERYLTRKETAAKLHISLPTLNEITKKGIVYWWACALSGKRSKHFIAAYCYLKGKKANQ